MGYKKCSVNGCKSNTKFTRYRFFRIPDRSEELRAEWFAAVDLPETKKTQFMCELHFNKQDIIKNRLKKDAIPQSIHSPKVKDKIKKNLKTRRCVLRDCRNFKFINKNMKFCIFPSDPDIRDKWLQFCGLENVPKNSFLCREHFSEQCFPGDRRKIKSNSVPTIFPETDTNVINEESAIHKVN